LVIPIQHTLNHTDTNQLAKTPTEVDVCGQISSQRHGAHLRGIGDGQGLEYTPWNTAKDLRNKQGLYVFGCEEDGRPSTDEDETGHNSISVTEAFRGPAIDE
jgi:hypothetical protein